MLDISFGFFVLYRSVVIRVSNGIVICFAAAYDYNEVLRNSLLFYQAQRSGRLTGMDPKLSWRKDSALGDQGDNGEDLTGGYYDGKFMKTSQSFEIGHF